MTRREVLAKAIEGMGLLCSGTLLLCGCEGSPPTKAPDDVKAEGERQRKANEEFHAKEKQKK